MSTHATLIFHESFNQDAGQLTVGRAANCNDSTKWWTTAAWYDTSETPNNPIMVTEGGFSYAGYVDAGVGNKAQLKTISGTTDVRRFKDIKTGSVYAAAIINVTSAKSSGDYFFGLCNGGSTYSPRVYAKGVDDGYQLSIAKGAELKTYIPYTKTLKYNTNYLIVVEYVCKEGTKNDSVNLWVNPAKSTTTPTLVCDTALANTRDDLSKVAGVYMRQTTNAPTVAIDEIKVATSWDDLFESDVTPEPQAELVANPTTLGYLQGYVGETYTKTFKFIGKNIANDVTITTNSEEVTVDKTTIAKETAAADSVSVTVTIKPTEANSGTYKVTLTSGDATATVSLGYSNIKVNFATTIAELNAYAESAIDDDDVYIKFTGEAVVTYKYNLSGAKLYLEDATGATHIENTYWGDAVKQGDKVTNFSVYATSWEDTYQWSIYIAPTSADILVLSSDNDFTPAVVTLADLKTNATKYYGHLVKVEGVTFATTTNFASGDVFTQGENSANLNLIAGNDLIGTAKPDGKADVVGISSSTSGAVLRARGAKDITAQATAIDAIAIDANCEIYTVSGVRVDALQAGVNIVRKGNQTYKVIR